MLVLEGVTVVSLEQAVAAPFATRQLADLGARVVKIERPGSGDFARGYDETVLGQSSYFVWLNRSKESLALDLKDPRGRALLAGLIARADVFVQNLAPGAAGRLGLGAEVLREEHPELIVCEISGYGQDGPWAGRKAYDLLVQSEAGVVSLTGTAGEVAKVGIPIADIAAGMYAFSGILAALYQRRTTGEGARVEVSMFEALAEWMGGPAYYTMYSGTQPARTGAEHATIAPYGPFSTADGGSVVVAVQNEREWASFCKVVLGDASLATDDRFAGNPARVRNREELRELVGGSIAQLETAAAEELLRSAGIATATLNSVAAFLDHPVLAGRDRWREVATPGGTVRALIPPAVPGRAEPRMGPVPSVGQHSAEILASLGVGVSELRALEADGVVSCAGAAGTAAAARPYPEV